MPDAYAFLLLIPLVVLVLWMLWRKVPERPREEHPLATDHFVDAMLRNSPAMVSVAAYTSDGRCSIALASPQLLRVLDMTQEQVLERTWVDVLGPVTGDQAQREDLQVLRSGGSHTFVTRVGARGHRRTLMATKFPLPGPGMGAVGMMALDVTEHRRRDRLMQVTFDLSPVAMARLGTADSQRLLILDANQALGDLLGIAPAQLRGQDLGTYVHAEVQPSGEVEIITADGRHRWVALTVATVEADGDEESFALGVFEDVTERHEAQTRLEHQATHDDLTGLPNRYALVKALNSSLAHLEPDSALAIMFCDLDGFKTLNDTLSHRAGDQVLVDVARRLRRAVRPSDAVARLGGDEFVVIAQGVYDENEAVAIGQRLCTAISDPFEVDGRTVGLGLSVGVTITRDPQARSEDLLRQADLAMYRAKDNGRNRVETYVEDLHDAALGRLRVEEQLRAALAESRVGVEYQPIVGLAGITALEALVRVPASEPSAASAVVQVAEQTGLIAGLESQVLGVVVRDVAGWQEQGVNTRVHINVSRSQLLDPGFPARCLDALDPSVQPGRICFEVGDSPGLAEAAGQAMWALRRMGFHIGLDGFGAGHAGLASLRSIPADYLKIHRSLIDEVATSEEVRIIVDAVIAVAHRLGRTVIATGVETQAQVDALRRLGCDDIQGYVHSAALAARCIPELVSDMAGASSVLVID
ncbi:MAG: EAL domain-containing protein [Actinobacteria bacterium]|nr:EAL domain-containing protein [Actinomycetota bacterium]MCB9428705.1 EAL domain-containing protein [Actinomycetota bacterium]MCO5298795.1 EAL domain-containing protein [Candidatus Nanopelagicales bacterium]HPE12156.1 EAL domain-containing protein [Actinomycetota bacterium]HRV65292.1 EAL domain-containing protein [Candidatus Nanopelagicales bacterium]